VDTEANKLSTQQSQVIIYTPQPGRLVRTGRSRPLCETSVSVDDLRRGGRYHGVHAWPVSHGRSWSLHKGLPLKTTSAVEDVILGFTPKLPLLSFEADVLFDGYGKLG